MVNDWPTGSSKAVVPSVWDGWAGAWLSCHLCFIAALHGEVVVEVALRRGRKKKSSVKLNGLLAVGTFSLEAQRRAGADGRRGGCGRRREPSRLFNVLHRWVTVIPLVSFPGMFPSAVAILIPFKKKKEKKRNMKQSLVRLLQNGAQA